MTPLEFPIELGRIADRQIVEGRRLQDRYGPDRVRWHAVECRSLGLWGERVGDVIFTQTALAGSHGRQLPVAGRGNGSLQGSW